MQTLNSGVQPGLDFLIFFNDEDSKYYSGVEMIIETLLR